MKSWMKVLLLILAGVLALGAGAFGAWYFLEKQNEQEMEEIERQAREAVKEQQAVEKETIRIEGLSFARISDREIEVRWPDQWDASVREYQVERRTPGTEGWEQVGSLPAGQGTEEGQLSWVDTLEDSSIRQYEYRVQAEPLDPDAYEVEDGEPVMASNLLLCIDPGHYAGKNLIQTEPVYAEGDFTLPLAQELEKILREEYGVTVRMTRESGDITLEGYSNDELDSRHISLRGEAAKGVGSLYLSSYQCQFWRGPMAVPPRNSPFPINKPILILNEPACQDPQVIRLANRIGSGLAKASLDLGIAAKGTFQEVKAAGEIREWTDAYNDATNVEGTVCRRMGQSGDYYGVLRGAANVGVPGMIIEHGFHTVPEMRGTAKTGEHGKAGPGRMRKALRKDLDFYRKQKEETGE